MDIYQKYAEVYDHSGQILFSVRMIPYVGKLLARHVPRGSKVLDLACGTGTVALALEKRGYEVTGIDASEDMLAQARRKAASANAPICFIRQDMRSFSLPERVGLITCLYDSANYMLEEEDLRSMFARAAVALEPGGLLMFDMNTTWMMEHSLNDRVEFLDFRRVSIAMVESYDAEKRRATVKIVGFIRRGHFYEKFTETHSEQSYSEEQLYRLLEEAGFWVEGEYECFTFAPPTRDTKRIMWVARRRAVGEALE